MNPMFRMIRALLLAAGLLLLASCGDDPTELAAGQPTQDEAQGELPETGQGDSGNSADADESLVEEGHTAGDPEQAPGEDTPEPEQSDEGEQPVTDGGQSNGEGYTRVQSRIELVSPVLASIESLEVAADGQTVLVRYFNASEPCSGASVSVNEGDSSVEFGLVTGLDPNAAAMTCMAGVFGYEIAVTLDAPVGDRALVAIAVEASEPSDEGPVDPLEDAVFSTDQYVGLTEVEARALGEVEQRIVRVVRVDDESFQVTMDFSPSRVNLEIEDGIVVVVTSG